MLSYFRDSKGGDDDEYDVPDAGFYAADNYDDEYFQQIAGQMATDDLLEKQLAHKDFYNDFGDDYDDDDLE